MCQTKQTTSNTKQEQKERLLALLNVDANIQGLPLGKISRYIEAEWIRSPSTAVVPTSTKRPDQIPTWLLSEKVADISRPGGSGAPAPVAPVPQQRPDQIQRVKATTGPVALDYRLGTNRPKFKYTAGRVTGKNTEERVTAVQIRGSSAVGQEKMFSFWEISRCSRRLFITGSQRSKGKPGLTSSITKPQITATQGLPQPGIGLMSAN
ncbi:hypothetical protein TNCT_503861 [Trichonephila clavata]|uniref:Uncharacterized protein n=1 Tax=Trichonephila clavata TaxID=2740835 RepID=A0A8X6ID00_TRICU|nr:hypothetical protein TNCT_503861 [Trichonephila clavata]